MQKLIHAKDAKPGQWYWVDGNRLILCVRTYTKQTPYVHFVNSELEFLSLLYDHFVRPVPDCTGWDWNPTPTYDELHAACGLKVGDRVKIVRATQPEGWDARWNPMMNEFVNKTATITREHHNGFMLDIGDLRWHFPCTSLEKIESKYRPFANAAEFAPHRDRWIRTPGQDTVRRVIHYSDRGVDGMAFSTLFRDRTFNDGSPCGVEVTP